MNKQESIKKENSKPDGYTVLSAGFFLDLADNGNWLIKDRNSNRYTAGNNKEKVVALIKRLNEAHRPNIEQGDLNEIYVCWNNHDKNDKCEFEREI